MRPFATIAKAWRQPHSFDELFPFKSETAGLVAVLGGLLISFVLFGFWWPYWRIADMDLFMVYNGFLLNDGLPQEVFDHPGSTSILLLGYWLKLAHGLGLVSVDALSALPPPADAGPAWSAAVRAGRVLSLLTSCVFVAAFAALLRRLVQDWRIAVLGAFALAFSGGMAMHSRMSRDELLCAALLTCGLLLLLIAARGPSRSWRPVLVGLGALLATLAFVNKVQVITLACALPLVALPFGSHIGNAAGFWRTSRWALPTAAALVVAAILIAIPASSLVWFGLTAARESVFHWRPLAFGTFGFYQPIIAAWVVLAMIAFAIVWCVPILETLATMACVLAGVALALLSLDIRYNPQVVLVVMNPLDQALQLVPRVSHTDGTGLLNAPLFQALLDGVLNVAARLTFVLRTSSRPTIFVEWLVIAGAIVAFRARQRKLVLQVAALMCVVWGVDTVNTLRGLKIEYWIFTDPLVIIAAALLLANVPSLRSYRWAYRVGIVLFAAHVFVGQAEVVKHTFKRDVPLDWCTEHFYYTKRVERFPFCPPPRT